MRNIKEYLQNFKQERELKLQYEKLKKDRERAKKEKQKREQNKEYQREYNRKYRETHKEYFRLYQQEYNKYKVIEPTTEKESQDAIISQQPTKQEINKHLQPFKLIGRFAYEDDVYQSWDEIKQAEQLPNETGRLNWDKLFQIIEQGRKEVETAVENYRNKQKYETSNL